MRTHEYEIIAHYKNDQPVARVWWDGSKIQSDSSSMLNRIKDSHINGHSFENSVKFLELLPYMFKNGYISVRKVKK